MKDRLDFLTQDVSCLFIFVEILYNMNEIQPNKLAVCPREWA